MSDFGLAWVSLSILPFLPAMGMQALLESPSAPTPRTLGGSAEK